MNRKAKLEKALAIQKLNPSRLSRQFNQGKEAENSRLAPLHEALLAAVEALEFYGSFSNWIEERIAAHDLDNNRGGAFVGPREGGKQAREALSKIDKVLADLGEK